MDAQPTKKPRHKTTSWERLRRLAMGDKSFTGFMLPYQVVSEARPASRVCVR